MYILIGRSAYTSVCLLNFRFIHGYDSPPVSHSPLLANIFYVYCLRFCHLANRTEQNRTVTSAAASIALEINF